MAVDLVGKMAELVALEMSFLQELELLVAPSRWEEKYIILPGETPFWEVEDPKEREKVRSRQYLRMWKRIHPKYFAGAQKEFGDRHPGYFPASAKKFGEGHPGYFAEAKRKYRSIRVHTSKGPKGTQNLLALYKRGLAPSTCELCGRGFPPKAGKNYHHWIYQNPSAGLWICSFPCDEFAEAVDRAGDSTWQLAAVYFGLKKQLDVDYADGEIVRLAKLAKRRRRVGTIIEGVYGKYPAWGKRDKPKDGLCEICHTQKCHAYHHWDDSILGKGIWACNSCHGFAGVLDVYSTPFIEKYQRLKMGDELRVLRLMKLNDATLASHMFPSLTGEHISALLV